MASRNGSGMASIAARTRSIFGSADDFFLGRRATGRLVLEELRRHFVAEAAFVNDEATAIPPRARLRRAAAIADDREQPCPRRAAAELGECAKGAEERILHDIVAQHRVARQVAREIIGAVEVRQDQLPEFVGVAGAGRGTTRRRTLLAASEA